MITTSTPRAARCCAVLRPRPRLPPVIRAITSGSFPVVGGFRPQPPSPADPGRTRSSRDRRSLADPRDAASILGSWTAPSSPISCAPAGRRCSPRTSGCPRGPAPAHRRAAPGGGRGAGRHVDRLLRPAGAAARPAAVGADAGRDGPGAAAVPGRAGPPVPDRRAQRPGAHAALRPRQPGPDAGARPARRHPGTGDHRLGETLLQTRLAVALLGDQTRFTGLARSLVYRWFTDPRRA